MIITGWYEKIFEAKILVPWDTPGVTGAPIFWGPGSRIWPMSNSAYLGFTWIPGHSGTSGSSRNSENDSVMMWFVSILGVVIGTGRREWVIFELSWKRTLRCGDSSATYYNLSRCMASAKTIKRRLVSPVVCFAYELEDKYVCFKTAKAKNKSHEQNVE